MTEPIDPQNREEAIAKINNIRQRVLGNDPVEREEMAEAVKAMRSLRAKASSTSVARSKQKAPPEPIDINKLFEDLGKS